MHLEISASTQPLSRGKRGKGEVEVSKAQVDREEEREGIAGTGQAPAIPCTGAFSALPSK
jgi:hypothetical protein